MIGQPIRSKHLFSHKRQFENHFKRNIAGECLEGVHDLKFNAVSRKARDFAPGITCHDPPACPQEVVPVVPPVCGNQCKAAGDVSATCNETGDNTYSCTCSAGFVAGETACEDVDECQEGSSTCEYGNCMNNDGSFECAAETTYTYSGVYQSATGNFESMTLENFKLFPRPSGKGLKKFAFNLSVTSNSLQLDLIVSLF